MKIVVKIGGQGIEERTVQRRVARQIAALSRSGHQVVAVHGGGKRLTETLTRLRIPTTFHQGLRVTDPATRDVALMVLAGMVNKQWVAELEGQGQPALGICGGDAGLVVARKLSVRANGRKKDLGYVGRPRKVSTAILEMAFRQGLVPVVASLALGPRGQYLNVNADDFAAAIAAALKADRLVYLTDAGGVWDSKRRLITVVPVQSIRSLIQKGIVRDGMIPKLRSCARTLSQKVGEIDILSPTVPNALLDVVQNGARVGTRIVRNV